MARANFAQVGEASPIMAFSTEQAPATEMTSSGHIGLLGPVCVVDDGDLVCDSVAVPLETYGLAVLAYSSGAEFLRDDRRVKAKRLIIDQHMRGMNGLEVITALHREQVFPPTILMTGRLSAAIAERPPWKSPSVRRGWSN
jgi:PleD family two-component response regulator